MNPKYFFSRIIKKLRFSAIRNSVIPKTSKVESGSTVIDTVFGDYSFCGYDCHIENTSIGKFCSIADIVRIVVARHPYEWLLLHPYSIKERYSIRVKFSEFARVIEPETFIVNDVWIGANVLVKSGVSIGDGAVIGMGSVVTKDVEPYSIVGGNPARHIKYRFDEEIRSAFKEIQWWDKDTTVIGDAAKEVKCVEGFINCFRS